MHQVFDVLTLSSASVKSKAKRILGWMDAWSPRTAGDGLEENFWQNELKQTGQDLISDE